MSKKNLLNESQVRQFMKLASLAPLTPGFVDGLTEADEAEELEELRTGRTGALGPKDGTHNPGHGRGQGEAADGSLFEEEELERELDATEDELGAEDHLADEEADELDDLADPAAGGEDRTISVDDFLSALETALETVMGDEVEIDSDEMGGDELEADVELDDGGEDIDLDLEEEPLQEAAFGHPPSATGAANNHKGSKQHPDHRNTKNSNGGLASQGPGLVKEEDDEDLEERQKYGGNKGDESRSKRDFAEGQGADDREDEHLGAKDGKESDKKQSMKDRRKEMRGARRAKGEAGDPVPAQESLDATDELVEQITKRVAARILKSALTKK